jgi:predicted kinase
MGELPGPVLVVAGPSGVGKSTVGARLAEGFARSAHVQQDAFLNFIVRDENTPAREDEARLHEVLGAVLATTALEFARCGYTVVVDGHLRPAGVQAWADGCASRHIAVHYAVLRTDLATCLTRATKRGLPFDVADYTAQHDGFADLGAYEGHAIDATPDPTNVSTAVMSAFRAGHLVVRPTGSHS